MILLVSVEPVDVSINRSITPIDENTWLRKAGKGSVGMRIVHAVITFLRTIEQRIVNHVAALRAISPTIVTVPDNLWCPYAAYGAEILIGRIRRVVAIAEDRKTLAEVERRRLPMNKVVTGEQVDAEVLPLAAFVHPFGHRIVHVSGHHQVARSVYLATDICITCASLNLGHLESRENGVTAKQVVVMQSVARKSVGGPLSVV